MGGNGMGGKEEAAFLRHALSNYLRSVGDLTAEEARGLRGWVASGNSVYDNPHGLYEESGGPMDYICAIRAWPILCDQLMDSRQEQIMLGASDCAPDDGLPF